MLGAFVNQNCLEIVLRIHKLYGAITLSLILTLALTPNTNITLTLNCYENIKFAAQIILMLLP